MPRDPERDQKKRTSFIVHETLHRRLKAYAGASGQTLTGVLEKAVKAHLDHAEADADAQ